MKQQNYISNLPFSSNDTFTLLISTLLFKPTNQITHKAITGWRAETESKMCTLIVCARACVAVSQSIQAVNEAVDAGDSTQTLAALRNPGAGLYGVTSECAQTYQTDLAKIKEEKKAESE